MIVFSRFLRYFVEVARLGSIRRASEHLNVAASAVNRQILQAEEALGVPLFERLPSGLKPTAAGELLLHSAKAWERDFIRLQEQIGDLKGVRRGHVRVATIDALSKGMIPAAIRDMRAEFPGIQFTLDVRDNKEVMGMIEDGRVDFGILLNPQSTRDVRVQAHMVSALGFVSAPDHAFAKSASLRFNACVGQPMLLPAEPLAISEQVQALITATRVQPVVAAFSDNIQMIKSLARQGVGIGLLSWLDVMEEVERGELCFTRIQDAVITPLTLSLCVGNARQLSLAANMLLQRLETVFDVMAQPG